MDEDQYRRAMSAIEAALGAGGMDFSTKPEQRAPSIDYRIPEATSGASVGPSKPMMMPHYVGAGMAAPAMGGTVYAHGAYAPMELERALQSAKHMKQYGVGYRKEFQYGGLPSGNFVPQGKVTNRVQTGYVPLPVDFNDMTIAGGDYWPERVVELAEEVQRGAPKPAAPAPAAPPVAEATTPNKPRELTIRADRPAPTAPAAMPENVSRALWEIYNRTENPADFVRADEAMQRERPMAASGGSMWDQIGPYRFVGESIPARDMEHAPEDLAAAAMAGVRLPRYDEPYFARRDERMPVQTDPLPIRARPEQPTPVTPEAVIMDAMRGVPEAFSPATRERLAASFAQPGERLSQVEQVGRALRGDAPEGGARARIAKALETTLDFSPLGTVSNFVEGVSHGSPQDIALSVFGIAPGGTAAARKSLKGVMDQSHRKFNRAEGGQIEDYDKGGTVKKALDFIRAYHGSPHKFDKFDAAKIGTGEGHQSYGHGLYFAGDENVARNYRDRLSGTPTLQPFVGEQPVDIKTPAGQALLGIGRDMQFYGFAPVREERERMLGNILNQTSGDPERSRQLSEALGMVRNLQRDQFRVGEVSPGHMYQVRIGTHPERLLDWDKPLYQQNQTIQDMFRNAPEIELGSELPKFLGFRGPGSARKESSALLEAGVPGIRYLDANSRGAADGFHNYVVFDPNIIDIERRYAQGGDVEGYGPGGSVIKRALQIAEDIGRLKRPGSGYEPVPGAPATVNIPGIGKVEARPIPELEQAASNYMRSVGRPNEHAIERFVPINEDFSRKVAQAFEEMPHDPANPAVRRAYEALADETLAQYRAAKEAGLDIRFLKEGERDPYAASPALGYEDIMNRGRLYVFPTEQGFGSSGGLLASNPLLKGAGRVGDKPDALVNDAFRVVHDLYGHFGPGNPFFRTPGEERAYQLHSRMYSPEARPAAATETRGQNSWVNFGPHAEHNRTALGGDTIYADQKTGILPDWAMELPPEKADGGEVAEEPGIVDRALSFLSQLNPIGSAEAAPVKALVRGAKSVVPETMRGTTLVTKDPAAATAILSKRDPSGAVDFGQGINQAEYTFTRKGDLQPWKEFDPYQAVKDRALIAGILGDKSAAGSIVYDINGVKLTEPINRVGGGEFQRSLEGPEVWASRPSAVKNMYTRINKGMKELGAPMDAPVLASHVVMGTPAIDSTQMMAKAILRQIEPTRDRIDPKAAEAFDAAIRKAYPDWPGILSPVDAERFLATKEVGKRTSKILQQLDTQGAQAGGLPNLGTARFAMMEPRLVSADQGSTGFAISRLDPKGITNAAAHDTYPRGMLGPTQSAADYMGGTRYQIPLNVMFPDWWKTVKPTYVEKKTGLTKATAPTMIQRNVLTQVPLQRANQEWLDNLMRHAEENPKKWGYRLGGATKQKTKKSGKVKGAA